MLHDATYGTPSMTVMLLALPDVPTYDIFGSRGRAPQGKARIAPAIEIEAPKAMTQTCQTSRTRPPLT